MSKELQDKNRHWLTISKKLQAWEIKLIEMRYTGVGYNEISDLLNKEFPSKKKFSPGMLRDNMYQAGKLRPAYDSYADLMGAESLEVSKQILKSATEMATRTMVGMLHKKFKSDLRFKASKELLDRSLGRAVQPVEVEDERSQEIDEVKLLLKNLTKNIANDERKQNAKKTAGNASKRKGSLPKNAGNVQNRRRTGKRKNNGGTA